MMNWVIIWSAFAENQLDAILEYYTENSGDTVAKKFVRSLINETNRLLSDPYIGQEEELLRDRKISYRYLISYNYKIIYSIDEEKGRVQIADVFDTRQILPK